MSKEKIQLCDEFADIIDYGPIDPVQRSCHATVEESPDDDVFIQFIKVIFPDQQDIYRLESLPQLLGGNDFGLVHKECQNDARNADQHGY